MERSSVAREKILDAALSVFSNRGFDGATTREIAAQAGVNLGLIKYYFDTKEKLWRAMVDRVHQELNAVVAGMETAQLDDRARMEHMIRAIVRFCATKPAFIRVMNDECKRRGPRMRWVVDRHGKQMFAVTKEILEHARQRGLIPDVAPLHLYYMFIGAIGMIFSQAPECKRLTGVDPTGDEATINAHADAVIALFLR